MTAGTELRTPVDKTGAEPSFTGPVLADTVRRLATRYSLVGVFFVVVAIFSLLQPDTFFTGNNAETIASTNAVVALLGLAAMAPLAAGQFDLSVAFQVSLAQSLTAGLVIQQGLDPSLAIVLVLLVGLLAGLANGLLVAYLELNAFIVTLASGILIQGFAQWYTNGESIFGTMPTWFLQIGRGDVLGIPYPLIYVAITTTALVILYDYTTWGRRTVATGSNARAAEIVGLPVRRLTVQSFVAAGILSALAGVVSVSLIGSSSPNVGTNLLLPAFAAAFLGATSIHPGRFNPIGTVLAVYVLASGITGLQQLGAPFYIEQFFNGGALLVAVALSTWTARRRATSSD